MTDHGSNFNSQINHSRPSTDSRPNQSASQSVDQSEEPHVPESLTSGLPPDRIVVTSNVTPPIKILIVARPATSRAISTALALAGYEVHRTPDANSAVEAARRLRPHLAIVATDIPGSTSQLVAGQLRSSLANLRIIVLGDTEPSSTGRNLERLPADVSPASLIATIDTQLVTDPPAGESRAH